MPGAGRLFHFEITGGRELNGRFLRMTEDLIDAREEVAEMLKADTLAALKAECPVWSGDLRDALDADITRRGNVTEVNFVVRDVPSSIEGKVGPAVYVQWVINGRGPVMPVNWPELVYPTDPGGGEMIYSQYSRPAAPNNFALVAVNKMDDEAERAVGRLAARVRRVWG